MHQLQRVEPSSCRYHFLEEHRSGVNRVDGVFRNVLGVPRSMGNFRLVQKVQLAAEEHRGQDFKRAEIKRLREILENAGLLAETEIVLAPVKQRHKIAERYRNAFRPSGRTRRIDHVCGLTCRFNACRYNSRRSCILIAVIGPVTEARVEPRGFIVLIFELVETDHVLQPRACFGDLQSLIEILCFGDKHFSSAVGYHKTDAIDGMRGIDGNEPIS